MRSVYSNSDAVVLKLDVKNAFNSLPRAFAAEAVAEYPRLSAFFRSRYHPETTIRFHGVSPGSFVDLHAGDGVLQGEPSSGAIFSLTQARSVLNPVRELFPSLRIFSYHDDVYLVGNEPDVVFTAFDNVLSRYSALGMELVPSKCVALTRNLGPIQALADARGVPVTSEGTVIVGAPVGTDAFCIRELERRAEGVEQEIDSLYNSFDRYEYDSGAAAQHYFHLIRLCLPSQFIYSLRTSPPRHTVQITTRVDSAIRRLLYRVLALPGTPDDDTFYRDQLSLPTRYSGFNILCLANTAAAAYAASVVGALPVIGNLDTRSHLMFRIAHGLPPPAARDEALELLAAHPVEAPLVLTNAQMRASRPEMAVIPWRRVAAFEPVLVPAVPMPAEPLGDSNRTDVSPIVGELFNALEEIRIRYPSRDVHDAIVPYYSLEFLSSLHESNEEALAQIRNLQGRFSDAIDGTVFSALKKRITTSHPHHLPRLNSCANNTSAAWLHAHP
ncbi:MAG: reverse transcriptase domain-containing protein, partial [Chthoniobacteraceae bacterium]|nr:reverse transcriptase domain-containing protein [Chthoniobacteraceae bacterium]